MASLKARLTVALKANYVVVAELEDAGLWQRVLTSINLSDSAPNKLDLPLPVLEAAPRGTGR